MTIRFLADEDIRVEIVRGLQLREPAIDILDVKTAGLRGMKDPALLELADQQHRILLTYDRTTMTEHFRVRLEHGRSSPGVFVLRQDIRMMGDVIEWLVLVWAASQPEEWRDRIVYL